LPWGEGSEVWTHCQSQSGRGRGRQRWVLAAMQQAEECSLDVSERAFNNSQPGRGVRSWMQDVNIQDLRLCGCGVR
jgi:hypothetical protein